MKADDDHASQQRLAALLATYQQALAAGLIVAGADEVPFEQTLDPNLVSRLRRAQACLRLLEQAWPNGPPPSTGFAHETPPALPQAGEQSAAPAHSAGSAPPIVTKQASEAIDFRAPERFEIRRRIGAGGMGVVYEAYDRARKEFVALKTMRHVDPGAIYRLKQEFRTLADVTHPNLVALHELFSTGEQWFFTMELVAGVDFLSHVRAESDPSLLRAEQNQASESPGSPTDANLSQCVGPVTDWQGHPRESMPLAVTPRAPTLRPFQYDRLRIAMRQLAEGLCGLHRAGKLHRDIKPSNVLVASDGRVVLLDFGLATESQQQRLHDSTRQMVGTLAYMAPEQAACLPLSPASDWYSVGVMLYELLTGSVPFTGPLLPVLMAKHVLDPPSPSQLVPGIPEDLSGLCTGLLSRDPESRPSGAEVIRRLESTPSAPPIPVATQAPAPRAAPFVGRTWQLDALADAFAAARRGAAVSVYIHGKSGLGKTALAQHFLEDLMERDQAVVLAGRCYERESVPYKAVDSMVDALSRYLRTLPRVEIEAMMPRDIHALTRVFPVLRRVEAVARAAGRSAELPDQQELRRRAFAALRELLARLGDRRPLVLSIDDLQWGDLDSAALLTELLRPPDSPPLLFVGCYRSEDRETSACLRALAQAQEDTEPAFDRRQLAVEELTETEAADLVRTLLGDDEAATGAHADWVARESRGNPFFVYELVQYLQASAPLPRRASPSEAITLEEVLWARVVRLAEVARRLLEFVAVAGRPISQADACDAAGLSVAERMTLATLRSVRLIRSSHQTERDEIEPYHDRIREAVLAHLSPATLQNHHRQLAHTLESSRQGDPEVLAVHFDEAGEFEKAGQYYARAAAQAAEQLAFDRAAKLYRRALTLQSTGSERELRIRLADALANAGRGAEAAREYLTVTPGADIAERIDLERNAALQLLISGHLDEGLDVLRRVLNAVGMTLPNTSRRAFWSLLFRRLQLRLRGLNFRQRDSSEIAPEVLTQIDVCWSAALGLSVTDQIRGAYFNTRELLLALDAGEPHRLCRALAIEAGHVAGLAGPQSHGRTTRLLDAADRLAKQLAHPYALGSVSLAKGIVAFFEGRWKQSHEFCDHAERIHRDSCTGVAWEVDTAQAFSLWSLTHMGNVVELTARWPVLLKEARERGDLYAETTMSMGIMPLIRLAANDPAGARRDLREVAARWPQQGFHTPYIIRLWDVGQIDLYMGDAPTAWSRINKSWPALAKSFVLRSQEIRVFLVHLHARSALAAAAADADSKPLLTVAQNDARRLEHEKVPWAAALAGLIRAGVAVTRGDIALGATLLVDAIEGLEAVDMLLYAAAARRRLGELKRSPDGDALIQEADSWMNSQQIHSPSRMTGMLAPGFNNPSVS